ncbi:MAG: PAS domain-containing methyl-accepting chemotaxis protein [Methanomicrobiaceae archaeon]|nr:PAS domain-containing methyl-accepting chemotaxis protein [Methanomicrobiaceae archaeon]
MELNNIIKILKQAIEGDHSVRIDSEACTDPELRELSETINTAIEFLVDCKNTTDNVQMMIAQNPMPIVVIDSSFNIIDANQAYADLMELSIAEALSADKAMYKAKTIRGEGAEKLFLLRKKTECELEITLKSGKTKYVEQYGVPLVDESNNVNIAMFVFNDVTKEKEEEEENAKNIKKIEALQERSETIVQQNPMPILLCDNGMNIRVVNPAYSDISGIKADKLTKMSLRDFKVLEQKGEGIKHVFETKKRSYGEVTVEFPSGVKILEQYGIPVFNTKGDIANLLIVYNEITEVRKKEAEVLKLMEEQREKAELLEQSTLDIGKGLRAISEGDFTVLVEIRENDPLEELKDDYNKAIEESRTIFGDAIKAMIDVESYMSDANHSTGEVSKASEQVAVSSQKSAELTRGLLRAMEEISRQISDMSASNEEIASTSQEVLNEAGRVTQMGRDSEELGRQATTKMKAVMTITNDSVNEIEDLNNELKEINNVVKLINEITNQINMLALNAAIEAARAGEHGRGFAVVAGEVKNLATDAREATSKIDTVIENIQKASLGTVESIKSANAEVTSGVDIVNSTIEALNRIVDGAEHVTINMGEIAHAIEDQANTANTVVSETEKSTGLAGKVQSEIDDLAALSQETSASVEEIASAIDEVTGLAKQIKDTLNQLKV